MKKTYLAVSLLIGKVILEKNVFQGLLKKLFIKEGVRHFFDDDIFKQRRKGKNISIPDAYLRIGDNLFLFEFKDLIVPGEVIESGSFESIKAYLDKRLNSWKPNERSGVGQLLNQFETLANEKFKFDEFSEKTISIYPIIVHTSFIFRTPMINTYLNNELFRGVKDIPNSTNLNIQALTVIDLATFFNFCRVSGFDLNRFEKYLKFYRYVVAQRDGLYMQNRSVETNFAAGISFDEVFEVSIYPNEPKNAASLGHLFLEVIGADEDIFRTFQEF